jgi:hypothetical protein
MREMAVSLGVALLLVLALAGTHAVWAPRQHAEAQSGGSGLLRPSLWPQARFRGGEHGAVVRAGGLRAPPATAARRSLAEDEDGGDIFPEETDTLCPSSLAPRRELLITETCTLASLPARLDYPGATISGVFSTGTEVGGLPMMLLPDEGPRANVNVSVQPGGSAVWAARVTTRCSGLPPSMGPCCMHCQKGQEPLPERKTRIIALFWSSVSPHVHSLARLRRGLCRPPPAGAVLQLNRLLFRSDADEDPTTLAHLLVPRFVLLTPGAQVAIQDAGKFMELPPERVGELFQGMLSDAAVVAALREWKYAIYSVRGGGKGWTNWLLAAPCGCTPIWTPWARRKHAFGGASRHQSRPATLEHFLC